MSGNRNEIQILRADMPLPSPSLLCCHSEPSVVMCGASSGSFLTRIYTHVDDMAEKSVRGFILVDINNY